jgi:8-oxo-dGTP pyrophosphatase MutT (NUDIX family)
MATRKKDVTCAGTIVFRMNEVGEIQFLFIRHPLNEQWGLPKGHCELNESIEEAAVRETWEETGVIPRLLYELPPTFTSNKRENKTVHIFLAKQLNPQHGIQVDGGEIKEARWFSVNELPEMHHYQKSVIQYAKNIINRNMSK